MVLIKAIGLALVAATPALCCIGHGNPGAEDYQSRLKSYFAHRGVATNIPPPPEAVTTTLAVTKTITETVNAISTPTATSSTPTESGHHLIPVLGDSEEWLEALESQHKTLLNEADPNHAHLQASMELLTGLFEQNIAQDRDLKGVVDHIIKTIYHRLDMVKSSKKHGKNVESVDTLLTTAETLLQVRMENQGQKWYDFDVIGDTEMPGWPKFGGTSAHDEDPVPTASETQDEQVLKDSPSSPRNFAEADLRIFAHELRHSLSYGPIRRKPKPEIKALLAAFYGRQFKTSRSLEQMKADCSRFDRDWSFLSIASDTETSAVEVFKILNKNDQEMILDAIFCDTYVPSAAEADTMHKLLNKLWQEQGEDLKIPENVGEGCGCGTCRVEQWGWAKAHKQPLFWDAWKEALLEEHSRTHPKNITVDVWTPRPLRPHRLGQQVTLSMTFNDVDATSSLEEKCAEPSFKWEEQQWHLTGWSGTTRPDRLMPEEIRGTLKSVICQAGASVKDVEDIVSIYKEASKHWEKHIYTEPLPSGKCGFGYEMNKRREAVRREAFFIRAFAEWPRPVEEIAKEVGAMVKRPYSWHQDPIDD